MIIYYIIHYIIIIIHCDLYNFSQMRKLVVQTRNVPYFLEISH